MYVGYHVAPSPHIQGSPRREDPRGEALRWEGPWRVLRQFPLNTLFHSVPENTGQV